MEQKLGSTRLPGGTTIAYATAGGGPLLLFIGGWLSHLELSWALPAERHLFEGLARGRTVIRYDRPGCGLSDRPTQASASLESELDVVAAVIAATDAERVDVMASSLGVPVAVAWAARHPETVDRMVLYGGWARGTDIAPAPVREHVVGLVASHWGLGADVLTDIFAPEASVGTRSALAAYQRHASSAETAANLLELCYHIDVTDSLGQVTAPRWSCTGNTTVPPRSSRRGSSPHASFAPGCGSFPAGRTFHTSETSTRLSQQPGSSSACRRATGRRRPP